MDKIFSYVLIGGLMLFFFSTTSCATAERVYRGRVVDFDTKEPIEGAAVVVFWEEASPTVAGESTRLKDVKEILTDQTGEWSITGPKGRMHDPHPYLSFFTGMHYTRYPNFVIFKPGYCPWPQGFFIEACEGKIKPGGIGGIMEGKDVELSILLNKADRIRAKPAPIGQKEDWKKQKTFIKLIREEWKYLYSKDPGNLYEVEEE